MADQAQSGGQAAGRGTATPAMQQYLEIKRAHPDCLLFYQMGDFYELFFEDAVAASQALGIQLTKRGKHQGEDVPMCGVPVRRADEYMQRLIASGFRVAVCEQTEEIAQTKKRGAKALVRRDVVRLVTPGTLTEDDLLDARESNFLTALFRAPSSTAEPGETFALASLDISTGEFLVSSVTGEDLAGELARIGPGEVLVGEESAGDKRIAAQIDLSGAALTPVPRHSFDSLGGERTLKERLGVASLEAFGAFARPELAAVAALIAYVDVTQVGHRPHLRAPKRSGPREVLVIDAATRANLEIIRSIRGERRGSLLAAVDRTLTGAGARELAARLASPLTDEEAIQMRLDAAGFLLDQPMVRARLRADVKAAPDIARALARLALSRGGPRDLGAVRTGLEVAAACGLALADQAKSMGFPSELEVIAKDLAAPGEGLLAELRAALGDELPINRREGGFVRAGYRSELDEHRALRDDSRKVVAALQAKYAEETGVKSLKVRHNNVLGYFVEVTAINADALLQPPLAERFIHRQTMANAVRFTTTELAETEAKIVTAADRALALELEIFAELRERVAADQGALSAMAHALARLDHYCGLAELAEEQRYVRPKVDGSLAFEIAGGRHPVVEQALAKAGEGPFVENDCDLGSREDGKAEAEAPKGRLWIVTGPNMAGKSTFLRQNALSAVLAQMGSFVPASSAHIGVVDRLFSRVGAADDIAGGRSTFMVEMVETAGILNQASERSLVVLDEIGRGTATFDGLSIAWACAEYLHDVNRCRALFATHYHELTALVQSQADAANVTIEVKEWKDDIIFLHKVVAGAADRSYGIQVAKLAGLPKAVIARAHDVLARLESDERRGAEDLVDELPLFASAVETEPKPAAGPSELETALGELIPDELTPRQALEALYRLKGLMG